VADKDKPSITAPSESADIPISQEANRPAEKPLPFHGVDIHKAADLPPDALSKLAARAAAARAAFDALRRDQATNHELGASPVVAMASDQTKPPHETLERTAARVLQEHASPPNPPSPPPTPPPEPPIHGPEGPLPRTWQEAVPYLVWVVLILGFGLECVAHLLRGEILQAIFALGGMVGLAAMMLHWTQIRGKFNDTRWLVAAGMLLLLALILSPFVEEKRWPFLNQIGTAPTVIYSPPSAEDIAKATAPIQAELDAAKRQREEAQSIISNLRRELEAAQQSARQPPPPPESAPLTWESDVTWVTMGSSEGGTIPWFIMRGSNPSSVAVQLKDAYIASNITGERHQMVVDAGVDGKIPISLANPVPPGASITLMAEFTPPLPIKEIAERWMRMLFRAEYESTIYSRSFDLEKRLRDYPELKLGPRVTKKQQ
jgi:hypothetical protein